MEGMGQKFIPTLVRSFLGLLYVSLDLQLILGLIATLKNCLHDCFCHLPSHLPTHNSGLKLVHTQNCIKMIENPTSSQLEG